VYTPGGRHTGPGPSPGPGEGPVCRPPGAGTGVSPSPETPRVPQGRGGSAIMIKPGPALRVGLAQAPSPFYAESGTGVHSWQIPTPRGLEGPGQGLSDRVLIPCHSD